MQDAIPYRSSRALRDYQLGSAAVGNGPPVATKDDLKKRVQENAVTVVGRRGCCMTHVVKLLLQGLGASPAVYEVEHGDDDVVEVELPAVFIGGRWFGGLERVMGSHITGELTPLLKQAGALWL